MQARQIQLQTPKQNQSFAVGEQVQIVVLLKTQYPRLLRVDFRANGQLIGSGTWRSPRINWTPTQAGNYNITAEAISLQGSIISTATTNVSILTVLYDHLGGPNAPGGARPWEWEGQTAYGSWSYSHQLQGNSITAFIGNLSEQRVLRRVEATFLNGTPTLTQFFNLENILFFLKIWNANLPAGGFATNCLVPSLLEQSLGSVGIDVGSRTTPAGFNVFQGISYPVYHLGWNVNITLPAGIPLEISIQAIADGINYTVFSYLSGASSPSMIAASRIATGDQTNETIPHPLAARFLAQS